MLTLTELCLNTCGKQFAFLHLILQLPQTSDEEEKINFETKQKIDTTFLS